MAAKNGTYVIGCKLPHGLIISGAGKKVHLKGKNSAIIFSNQAYGVTENVPAEVWDEYIRIHGQSNAVKNGSVFAVSDLQSVKAAAEERKDVKTGFEQLTDKQTSTKADKEE